MYVYVYFFCRFFKIGDKKTQWETYTPAGRGGGGGGCSTARWDIYNVPLYRPVFKELSLGLDIEIREQLLDSEEFGKFSLV